MISLQERLIERALEAGASDLHIEPFPQRVRLRLRVDGWLHELDPLPQWMHAGLVSRFKILASMDVTERRRPQDGRSTFRSSSGDAVDLRVATAAPQHGEKVTIRFLPRSREPPDLEDLGLDRQRQRHVEAFIAQPHGLVLAAGPTGAGKTTTLYALLRRIDVIGRSVVTLEDPIEYTLPEATQIAVRASIGVNFACALRSILRHDPDVILLGEIRDEETAAVAVRAATTGHLVLSSVHTNSATESVLRLFELGVPAYLVASALTGVVSQRLVRRLCRRCRAPYTPSANETDRIGLPAATARDRYFENVGCSACRSGFVGRTGVFETLTLQPELRRLVTESIGSGSLERHARANQALLPLRASARAALRRGETTIAEVARVVPPAAGPGFSAGGPEDRASRTGPRASPR
jgi:type II secretory ATPase GspE/PulE/Tfp pilus assembly ATPase PilB-like protein